MSDFSFNINSVETIKPDRDVLSVFKKTTEKDYSIRPGMTSVEISEVVSEKIVDVIKAQFEETKRKFETKEKQKTTN